MQYYEEVDPKDVIKLVYKGVDVHINHKGIGGIARCSEITLAELFKYFDWYKKGLVKFYCWMDDEKENS